MNKSVPLLVRISLERCFLQLHLSKRSFTKHLCSYQKGNPSLKPATHINNKILGTVIPYLKKIQKEESRDASLSFANIAIFSPGIAILAMTATLASSGLLKIKVF